jgi:hypothetical protein
MAKKPAKLFEPWAPPLLVLPEIVALQAVAKGTASAEQQQHAMRVIVEKICQRYEMPYCPGTDGARNTDFSLGRMCAGTILTSFLNANPKNFKSGAAPGEQP